VLQNECLYYATDDSAVPQSGETGLKLAAELIRLKLILAGPASTRALMLTELA
jgi:hypothetical protein